VIALLSLPNATAFAQESAPAGKSFMQSASEERLYNVVVYSGKPELWREAIEFVKNEVVPIRLKGGEKHMECWTSVFGNVHEMWFFTPLESFAAMDKPTGLLLKALGSQEAVNAHVDKSRKYSISIRQFVIRVRPDLSYIKPNAPAPKLAVVIKSEIVSQRTQEFESYVKNDSLPVVRKSGRIGELRANIAFGGTGVLKFDPQESFANLDKGGAARQVLDAEGVRKMMAKLQGVIARSEITVLLFRPDLSILPK
jgi:hypothetical protein